MLRKISVYSLSKYFEMFVVAFIMLHFAKYVGAEVYGEIASSLIAVTYSAFIVLGINGAYVKLYSLCSDAYKMKRLSTFCLMFNLLGALIAFITVFLLNSKSFAALVGLICACNLFRGAVQSILRATMQTMTLSLYNFLFALIYMVVYGTLIYSDYANSETLIFFAWGAGAVTSVIMGIIILVKNDLISLPPLSQFKSFVAENSPVFLKNGVKLASLTFASIFLMSSDRILLINLDFSSEIIGFYQFADSVSNVFYMGSSALLYLLTPHFTREINEGRLSPERFIKKGGQFGLIWLPTLLVFLGVSFLVIRELFPEYKEAVPTIWILSVTKYLMLLMFIPNIICMTFNIEMRLLHIFSVAILLCVLVQFALCVLFPENVLEFLPLTSSICVFVVLLVSTISGYRFSMSRVDSANSSKVVSN
ncbi:MAG: lipopolysaccharide biosynthesis protein [Aestuariibacter sp.]